LLSFISEPEAAALSTLKDLSTRSTVKVTFNTRNFLCRLQLTMQAGDTMIVCDAGGGTVVRGALTQYMTKFSQVLLQDLISYQIESMEPFVVRECVKGDGECQFSQPIST
jgi:hypothetical protein